MAFFGKSKKCKCQIQLLVQSVEADCSSITEFILVFERGPQKVESLKFQLGPSNKKADIMQLFHRESGFEYNSKSNKWEKKEASLTLNYFEKGKKKEMGKIKFNVAEFVDKGEVQNNYKFEWISGLILNAKANLTFKVDSGTEGQAVKPISGAKTSMPEKKAETVESLTADLKRTKTKNQNLQANNDSMQSEIEVLTDLLFYSRAQNDAKDKKFSKSIENLKNEVKVMTDLMLLGRKKLDTAVAEIETKSKAKDAEIANLTDLLAYARKLIDGAP